MTKLTANIILLMLASTWCWLSIDAGYILEVSEKFIWVCGILVAGNGIDAGVTKWKGGNAKPPTPVTKVE